ncbi:hypothetical protein Sste5346_003817 [Sporothrix stenoceras]|uniref:Uncharacterized protein n=1 Tax=Sporothrix stenoceras TaxID=5173 RepID=A0ABR3ZCA6_9PEZI
MSGLNDEAVREGHDLIDGAEHEAKADPSDFKKVHHVGETGGSILPDDSAAASTDKPAATSSKSTAAAGGSSAAAGSTGQAHQSPGEFLEQKLNELKQSQPGEFLESKLNELKDTFGQAKK